VVVAETDSMVDLWVFNKSPILAWPMHCPLSLPTENFCLTAIFNCRQRKATELPAPTKTAFCFYRWRGCSDGLKKSKGKGGSTYNFHDLKEPNRSNGSSEELRLLPLKGERLCLCLHRDTAAAPPSLLLLKILLWLFWWAWPRQSARLQTPAPPFERCLWTSVAKRRFPLGKEIRDADVVVTLAFSDASLSSNACPTMCCQGYNVLRRPT